MFRHSLMIGILAAPLLASSVFAQTWDAPTFLGPKPMDDIGLYYFHSGGPDVNGLKGIWRQSGNLNLGVQAGVGDLSDAGHSILIGAEWYSSLTSMAATTGLAMSWSIGAGATFPRSAVYLTIPVGVSIGLGLGQPTGVGVTPYVYPRVSLDVFSRDETAGSGSETTTDVRFALDLGADVSLGEQFVLRGGYSLGDRNAFGVGVALRTPRKIIGPAR